MTTPLLEDESDTETHDETHDMENDDVENDDVENDDVENDNIENDDVENDDVDYDDLDDEEDGMLHEKKGYSQYRAPLRGSTYPYMESDLVSDPDTDEEETVDDSSIDILRHRHI